MTPIDTQVVLARMNGVEAEVADLRTLAQLSFEEYKRKPNFQLAEYHLYRALEGVLNIAAHMNAKKAGGASAGGYKEIARTFGELGFIDRSFADERLSRMAGYRIRLAHFYADVTPEETYKLLTEHLEDFVVFLTAVRAALEHPEQFGVTVE